MTFIGQKKITPRKDSQSQRLLLTSEKKIGNMDTQKSIENHTENNPFGIVVWDQKN